MNKILFYKYVTKGIFVKKIIFTSNISEYKNYAETCFAHKMELESLWSL